MHCRNLTCVMMLHSAYFHTVDILITISESLIKCQALCSPCHLLNRLGWWKVPLPPLITSGIKWYSVWPTWCQVLCWPGLTHKYQIIPDHTVSYRHPGYKDATQRAWWQQILICRNYRLTYIPSIAWSLVNLFQHILAICIRLLEDIDICSTKISISLYKPSNWMRGAFSFSQHQNSKCNEKHICWINGLKNANRFSHSRLNKILQSRDTAQNGYQ